MLLIALISFSSCNKDEITEDETTEENLPDITGFPID